MAGFLRVRVWLPARTELNHYTPYTDREHCMPIVKVRDNEPFEVALRRFKRSCEKAGIVTELRRREAYEKPNQERKRKRAAAAKRTLNKVMREQARRTRLY